MHLSIMSSRRGEAAPLTPLSPQALIDRETFLIVSWCGFGIATLCVIGRLAIRWSIFHRLAIEDYLVLLAWAGSAAFSILWHIRSWVLYATLAQILGKAPMDASFYDNLAKYNKTITGAIISWMVALWLVKYSFLFFFRNIATQLRLQKILWWSVTVFVTIGFAISIAVPNWKCQFGRKNMEAKLAACSTPKMVKYNLDALKVLTPFDIATDIAILILPIVIIWQVRLSFRRKLALAALFALTLFIVLCAILRIVIVLETAVGSYTDNTWLFLWNKVELDTAIVVACLGSFRTLYVSRRDRRIAAFPGQESPKPMKFNVMKLNTWSSLAHDEAAAVDLRVPSAVHVAKESESEFRRLSEVSQNLP